MNFKSQVSSFFSSAQNPSRLDCLLLKQGLLIEPQSPSLKSTIQVGQAIARKLGLLEVDVSDHIKQFFTAVESGQVSAPEWITDFIKQNGELLGAFDMVNDVRFDDFLLKVICFVFWIRVSVFEAEDDKVLSVNFGEDNPVSFLVLKTGETYRMLSAVQKNADQTNLNFQDSDFDNKISSAKLYKRPFDALFESHIQDNSFLDEPSAAVENSLTQIRQFSGPAENSLKEFAKSNFKKLKRLDLAKKAPPTYTSYIQVSVRFPPCFEIGLDESAEPIHGENTFLKDFDELLSDEDDFQDLSSLNLTFKQFNGFGDDITNTYRQNSQTPFKSALKFIECYQSSYNDHIREYIDSKGRGLDENGFKKRQSTGILKFYNDEKRFGFITSEDGKEVFVHKESLVKSKIDSKGLENCALFFTIRLEYQCLFYKGRDGTALKAVDLTIINFVPKDGRRCANC